MIFILSKNPKITIDMTKGLQNATKDLVEAFLYEEFIEDVYELSYEEVLGLTAEAIINDRKVKTLLKEAFNNLKLPEHPEFLEEPELLELDEEALAQDLIWAVEIPTKAFTDLLAEQDLWFQERTATIKKELKLLKKEAYRQQS